MKIRNLISLSFFMVILTVASCNRKEGNSQISIYSTDDIMINNDEIRKPQIIELSDFLIDLELCEKEVYSKPSYIITIQRNDSTLLLSIFEKEKFILHGHYLDAWDDRMRGDKTTGFKLKRELLAYLENYK